MDKVHDSNLLWRFWRSGKGYWGRSGLRTAWPLCIGLVIVILVNLAVDFEITEWNRKFFDALEQRLPKAALIQAAIFIPLVAASVILGVLSVYFRMSIQRKWRAWMNDHVTKLWFSDGHYFKLNLAPGDHKNAECRIAEDLRIATDAPVDFAAGLFAATLSAIVFIAVLWEVGGSLVFEISHKTIYIPGFLVFGAVIYSGLASTLTIMVGKRFVSVVERKNQREAEYRYSLTHLRETGSEIHDLAIEVKERIELERSFSGVLRTWHSLCFQHMRMTVVSQASRLLSPVVPVLMIAPKYLNGSVTLGEVMQVAAAFVIVQGAFGWIVDNYARLADWLASVRRLASLLVSLDMLAQIEQNGERPIKPVIPSKVEPIAES